MDLSSLKTVTCDLQCHQLSCWACALATGTPGPATLSVSLSGAGLICHVLTALLGWRSSGPVELWALDSPCSTRPHNTLGRRQAGGGSARHRGSGWATRPLALLCSCTAQAIWPPRTGQPRRASASWAPDISVPT